MSAVTAWSDNVPTEVAWYDATATQQGIWLLDRDERLRPTYLIPCVLELTGPVAHEVLVAAVRRALGRHPALRSRFRLDRQRHRVQYRTDGSPAEVCFLDAGRDGWSAEEVARLVELLCWTPFDLAGEAPTRADVIRLDADRTLLVLVLHHIAFDGWSRDLLVGEITATYRALLAGREPRLGTPRHPAEVLAAAPRGGVAERTEEVVRRLRGAPTRVELPYDRYPDGEGPALLGETLAVQLEPELSARVLAVAGQAGCTPFMLAAALLAGTLARRGGQRDFLFAYGWPGREDPAAADVVGMFMATLVLRLRLEPGTTWRQLLLAARVAATESFIDADVPLSAVSAALNPGRQALWPPMTPVLINVDDVPRVVEVAAGVVGHYRPIQPVYTKYDLDLFIRADGGPDGRRLELSIDFPHALFERATILDLLSALSLSAEALADSPEDPCVEPQR